ncbi:S-adenosyl-L-methionine-dependent methyltransferase [Mucor mucedo]|uniref:S-adenosyl-L-methionine-dependent methyltransferase n=1 Tax=Mucor mucedo TaxID=29922 RepID=UPI00221FDD29|nr:S-adenosyl-L-methionine-dependent methyltransferase [Mucor mucedo]KAI7894147.1 S-adenosyl-L-methionine-dependent methyltransferase [Mucor mucedo]
MDDTISYLKVVAPESAQGQRIRRWLLVNHRDVAKTQKNLHRAFSRKEISVNGEPVEECRLLAKDDVIEVKYDKSIEEAEKMKIIPIKVSYEDPHLAVVWKPSGQTFVTFEKAIEYNTALKDLEGNREKVWCINDIQKAASGLIIVAKTPEMKDALMNDYKNDEIQVTMRLLVHGSVPTVDIDTLFRPEMNKKEEDAEPIVPTEVVKSISIVSQTRSNNSQFISKIDLELHTPLSNCALRKLFYFHSDHPIIGNSNYTKPLKTNRDKGLCAALLAVSFTHPITKAQISVKEDEPSKFRVVCEREAKFYQNKLDRESDEIKKSGILPIDLEERKQGQLLAYILGQKDFFGHSFKITKDCLIPRASSETLVQAAITVLKNKSNPKVIDVGTGCGNLLISILHKVPSSSGVGVDISQAALDVAKENERSILNEDEKRIEWRLQDMSHISDVDLYDVLVCNPPYLDFDKTSKEKEQMAALEQEPAEALFAKDNGYEWYKVLSNVAPKIVKEDGYVVLECGKNMMEKVLGIWSDWEQDEVYKDIQGWNRCLVLKKSCK